MAQKFGNARWVKHGYFDNRRPGFVLGRVTFAGLGEVDFCLLGQCSGEIEGKVIQFANPQFIDDPRAGDSLEDFEIPQVGKVSLMSFDPHPLLSPHPYFEWFSLNKQHYRIELGAQDAWITPEPDFPTVAEPSFQIYKALSPLLKSYGLG